MEQNGFGFDFELPRPGPGTSTEDIMKNMREEADYAFFSDIMKNVENGIYPSMDGVYCFLEMAFLHNPHILMDAERILRTVVWELGPDLEKLPHDIYTGFFLEEPFEVKENILFQQLLNILINGLIDGNSFIKHLIVVLYKTYFPKEYKQYKRFARVTWDFIDSFVMDSEQEEHPDSASLAIFVAAAEDKPFDAVAYVFIGELERRIRERREEKKEKKSRRILEEATQIMDDITEDGTEASEEFERIWNLLAAYMPGKTERYTLHFLREYIWQEFLWKKDPEEMISDAIRTLKKNGGSREPSLQEIIGLFVYGLLNEKSTNDLHAWGDMVGYFCGYRETKSPDYFISYYDESKVKKNSQGHRKSEASVETVLKISQEPGADTSEQRPQDLEALEKELEAAKADRKAREKQLKSLREEYDALRAENASLQEELAKRKGEHYELSKLRSYVYSLTEEDLRDEGPFDRDRAVSLLREKTIVIIGGHENWVGKLRELFPGWTYVGANGFNQKISMTLDRADMIYFFTAHFSHKMFYKYIDYVRERELNFSYIHSVNIDSNLRQILHDVEKP